MRVVHKKLRSRRGMTLTEVLVALLILSLVTVGVAAGVSASLRVYRQATESSDAQMLVSTLSTALMDELRYARDISGTDTPTFTSDTFGESSLVGVADGRITVGGQKLLSDAAYAGLRVKTVEVTYADGVFHVELTVQSGTEDRDVRTASFGVRALNAKTGS